VPCWQVKPDRLAQWIAQRLKSRNLSADNDTCRYLAVRLEGNLLAAAQEIERLALLLPGTHVSLEQVRQAVADNARFDAFRLVDLVMTGHTGAALRCVRGLKEGDIAPPAVLWALGRELETAETIARRSVREPMAQLFRELRVWSSRQNAIQACINRLGARRLQHSVATLSRLDRIAKGQAEGDFWLELERFCAWLASNPSRRAA
ncbi:MAG: DNA polymerase III subunit delta, partial [Bacteroidota bacterium]